MFTRKGKGQGASTLLGGGLVALAVASSTQAALVTLSGIITNNTLSTQTYEFSQKVMVTEDIANVGAFGSLSFVVTDFNRNGAQITSSAGELYSGWINGARAKSLLPLTGGSGFDLSAPARSLARYDTTFASSAAPEALAGSLRSGDEIEVRLKFTLSAGDQAAYTGTFNLVAISAVPGPGAACMALLAPWFGLHRRRRAENAN